MIIDWTISIGNILTVLIIAGAFLGFAFKTGRYSEQMNNMQKDIGDMKVVQTKVATALTTLAVQDNTLKNQDTRLTRTEMAIEDIRHGRGFILPLGLVDRGPAS